MFIICYLSYKMIAFSKLDNKENDENQKTDNSKYVYILLSCKIINLCEGQSWFCKTYVKKVWSPHIMSLLWIARQTLNSENKSHKKIIDTLARLKIGQECKKLEVNMISDFIIGSCLCLSLDGQTSDTICQIKFIENICIEMLNCSKTKNKIKLGTMILLEYN